MKIKNYKELEATRFDTEPAKGVAGVVAIGKADGAENFCMRVFELDKDGYSPRHIHAWEHEIFVHSGNGEVFCDGKWVPISSGTTIFIPGNEDHQIRNLGASPLVFVCIIPTGVAEL